MLQFYCWPEKQRKFILHTHLISFCETNVHESVLEQLGRGQDCPVVTVRAGPVGVGVAGSQSPPPRHRSRSWSPETWTSRW